MQRHLGHTIFIATSIDFPNEIVRIGINWILLLINIVINVTYVNVLLKFRK